MEQEKNWNANDYIKMAEKCEDFKEYATALKYYEKAAELDPKQRTAVIGADRMRTELANQVYFQTEANYKLTSGRLELRNGLLVFVAATGSDMSYQIADMENLRVALGRLTFDYPGEPAPVGFSCKSIKEWMNVISDAKEGRYPSLEEGGYNALQKYIADHFSKSNIDEAIEYCTQMSGMGYADAKIIVEQLFK